MAERPSPRISGKGEIYLPRQIASQKGLKQTITLSMLDSDGT